MEGFCRSCLVKYDDPTYLIPYTEKNRRMFVYATGLQAKRNDTFTFQLCKDCYLNMKVACNFKKTSRTSDKKFKNYLDIKETGENVDFCSFLKNNDESLKFRLPMYNGSSTPANRKDDDNESTCTSIQNFMTDILRVEEIPDSEARIIREVIEEEADILEDSLDSHWLQDDVSVDTDFRLDFSPFSTPQSTNDDHCYTPKRHNYPTAFNEKDNIATVKLQKETDEQYSAINESNTKTISEDCEAMIENVIDEKKCVIDMNLENALKNDSAEKVMLDELLATPPVISNVSGPSTPLINNILFGDKLDSDSIPKKVYVPPDMIVESDMDVLYDFFEQTEVKDIKDEQPNYDEICPLLDISEKIHIDDSIRLKDYGINDTNDLKSIENKVTEETKEPQSPVENKYCLEKFYCNICQRQFKNVLALKVHCTKLHKFKIETERVKRPRKKMICDYCGKIFMSPQCIVKHIQNHMNPDRYYCDHCPLTFRTETGLKAHGSTHGILYQTNNKEKSKKYVCNICGSVRSSSSNHNIHLRRHANKYSMSCALCGKGFYRTSDLDTHMRIHTGERPFECMYCPRKFARQDALNRHIKCHTGERPYSCPFCKDKFINATFLKQHQAKCKTCHAMQTEVLLESSELNTTDKVTVFYAEVSNNEDVTKSILSF